MLLFLTACPPPPCEYQVIDFGSLSSEDKAVSPYVNGKEYRFRHSEGLEITFLATRIGYRQRDYEEPCLEIIGSGNVSRLKPDYPVFQLRVETMKVDSFSSRTSVGIGNTGFNLPTDPDNLYGNSYYDTLRLGEHVYHEVYRLSGENGEGDPKGNIRPFCVYYNTTYGILVVQMSNGEYYELIPEPAP